MSVTGLGKEFTRGETCTVTVQKDFAGLVVCWKVDDPPAPLPPHYGTTSPWFKRQIILHVAGTEAKFTAPQDGFVIDFREGFVPSNENVQPFARTYWESRGGIVADNGGCPVVD